MQDKTMEWTTGDLVWFDAGLGHPLPGEIQEVHQAAQIIVVQAVINGKVSNRVMVDYNSPKKRVTNAIKIIE